MHDCDFRFMRVESWGSMDTRGVIELEFIDGIMTKEVDLDILKRKLPVFAQKLKRWGAERRSNKTEN